MQLKTKLLLKIGIYFLVGSVASANNRTSKQFNTFEGGGFGPAQPPPPHISHSYNGGEWLPPSSDGYIPGPLPPEISLGYKPGPPPPILQSTNHHPPPNYYRPGPPPPPSHYESAGSGYFSPNYMSMPVKNPSVLYQTYPADIQETSLIKYTPGSFSDLDHPHAYGAIASASASASIHKYPSYGWGWIPPPPPPTPQPSPIPVPESPPTSASEESYGGGPLPIPPYPPRPVPEFSYQFSLRPSAFGWETSYNVPCGSYKIQPRVIAHLRLATQAVLPKPVPPPKSNPPPPPPLPPLLEEEEYDVIRRRKRSDTGQNESVPVNDVYSFLDPFHLERSLHYSPYHPQQFSIPKPTFRPRMCRWNFNAVGGCILNFKCGWFQLPALFNCEENYLQVTDSTRLLDRRFCGNLRPRQVYSSSSGKLTLTFKSEGSALPAILDCTVICVPEEGLGSELKTSPATTEYSAMKGSSPTSLLDPSFRSSSNIAALIGYPSNGDIGVGRSSNVSNTKRRYSSRSAKPQLRKANCKCGVPDSHYSHYSSKLIHGRVVGGTSMIPGESPWTAALVKKDSNRPYCGSVLINNRFLITAAHCVLNQPRKLRDSVGSSSSHYAGINNDDGRNKTLPGTERFHFDVLLNEHDILQINEIAGGTIRANVDKVIIHPNYDNVTFDFDAALIRLAQPIEFNSWVEPRRAAENSDSWIKYKGFPFYYNTFDFHSSLKRRKRFIIPEIEARAIPPKPVPICLPDLDRKGRSQSKEKNGQEVADESDNFALVTGWGLVTEGGVPSNEMLKARVQIFNDSTCHELYKKYNYVITDRMMCAGYINGKIDSCVGDSGSPLALEEGDRYVLSGVVSFGRGCGRKQLPGVYTRINSELMNWIYKEASTEDTIWCS